MNNLVDVNNLPKVVTAEYCDLNTLEKIFKFRSGYGHDYSDTFEDYRSMKYYYVPKDIYNVKNYTLPVYSPVSGTISYIKNKSSSTSKSIVNRQMIISPDQYPGISIIMFHISN